MDNCDSNRDANPKPEYKLPDVLDSKGVDLNSHLSEYSKEEIEEEDEEEEEEEEDEDEEEEDSECEQETDNREEDEEHEWEEDYWRRPFSDLFYGTFDCESMFASPRPIHDSSTWSFMRGVYEGVMTASPSASASLIPENDVLVNATHHLAGGGTGFHKRVLAKQSPGKGRGVFADELIRKGDLVWNASAHSGRFPNGLLYRRFLAAIPPDLTCDVLQWTYVQSLSVSESVNDADETKHEPDNRYHRIPSTELNDIHPTLRISIDFDEGCLVNDGDDSGDPNIGCVENVKIDCHNHYFALREIQVGEELLCSYSQFALTFGWEEFGL